MVRFEGSAVIGEIGGKNVSKESLLRRSVAVGLATGARVPCTGCDSGFGAIGPALGEGVDLSRRLFP